MIQSLHLLRIKELYELYQTKKLLGLKPEVIPYYRIPDYLIDISDKFIIYTACNSIEMTPDVFFENHKG